MVLDLVHLREKNATLMPGMLQHTCEEIGHPLRKHMVGITEKTIVLSVLVRYFSVS